MRIVFTKEVFCTMLSEKDFSKNVLLSLERFQKHDWGDISEEDKEANDRMSSGYCLGSYDCAGKRVWIMCNHDENGEDLITVLFPWEY